MRLLSLLAVLCTSLHPSCSFVNQHHRRHVASRTTMVHHALRIDPNDYLDDGSSDQVEQKRRILETMIGGDSSASSSSQDDTSQTPVLERRAVLLNSDSLPGPPPLTAIGKERRIAEVQLLARMADGDDSMDELWALWFSERGQKAAQELHLIEELTGQGPRGWSEAEERLLALIEIHGLYFSEAVNRLATLYFLWGRLDESKEACEIVLKARPWHVGALSGIVMVCASMGDAAEARHWAALRLPPMQPTGQNKRRREWVERALNDSSRSLLQAEKRVKQMFGVPDRRYKVNTFDDHNSWQ